MWSWEEWKKRFAWLRDLALTPVSVLWAKVQQWPLLSVLVVAVLTVLLYANWTALSNFINHAEDGKIIVNSPTVYTRQRLVNDRLDQARWLRSQLLSTENANDKEFKSIDTIHQREVSTTAAVGAASPSGSAQQQPSDAAKAKPEDNFSVEATTAARFRAKNAYREEVRSEITQTELDDRHDIAGNTIFRLTFDTSIIAGKKRDSIAGITIQLRHRPEEAKGPLKDIYQMDYKELYEEWALYFQQTIAKSMKAIPASINSSHPEPHLRLLFTEFLFDRICQFVSGDPDLDKAPISCTKEERPKAERLLTDYTAARLRTLDDFKQKAFSASISQYQASGDHQVVPADIRNLLGAATAICSQYDLTRIPLSQLNIAKPNDKSDSPEVDCPFYDNLRERLLSGVSLYENIFSILNRTSSNKDAIPPAFNDYAEFGNRAAKEVQNCDSGECIISRSRLRCFAADFIKSNLNLFNNPAAESQRKIDQFLTLRLVGRAVNDCNIVVLPFPKTIANASKTVDFKKFLAEFARSLNEATDAFAYSVTPKNLTENIATASDTRDAFEVLLRAKGEQSDVANFLRKRSEHNRAVVAHPIVVGIGSLDPAQDVARTGPGIRDISFGWIIASRAQDDGNFLQTDGQYSLTAFISAPAWWRDVELLVNTCWISRDKLADLDPAPVATKICPDNPYKEPVHFTVRLPPAIPEISHKLGFEVVQQPSIFDPQPQKLVVGQQGSLLLEGQRLWRSTEVTASGQRADRIVVLPNMEGIIAEFNCVLPPARQQQEDQPTTAGDYSVRVWTSEGVTDGIPLEYVYPADWHKNLVDCRKKNQQAGPSTQ